MDGMRSIYQPKSSKFFQKKKKTVINGKYRFEQMASQRKVNTRILIRNHRICLHCFKWFQELGNTLSTFLTHRQRPVQHFRWHHKSAWISTEEENKSNIDRLNEFYLRIFKQTTVWRCCVWNDQRLNKVRGRDRSGMSKQWRRKKECQDWWSKTHHERERESERETEEKRRKNFKKHKKVSPNRNDHNFSQVCLCVLHMKFHGVVVEAHTVKKKRWEVDCVGVDVLHK